MMSFRNTSRVRPFRNVSTSLVLLMRFVCCCAASHPWVFLPTAFPFASRAFLSNAARNPSHRKGVATPDVPKLILVAGCSGTGKSTFGMSLALDQGILKCISTDTVRSVMRSFIDENISPALHRSSYACAEDDGSDDPVKSWRETCTVLRDSLDGLVDEMIQRRVSLVVEGVHLVPSNALIEKWQRHGGVALGVLLYVPDERSHRDLLVKRGLSTGKREDDKLQHFYRIRAIQEEMFRLADQAGWLMIKQDLHPDPLDLVASHLDTGRVSVVDESNGAIDARFMSSPLEWEIS